jgi:hypothetical protein
MPPWHIDRSVGVQKFKNDISLTDEQVNTIARWVDEGAPEGNPKDLPPPKPLVTDNERKGVRDAAVRASEPKTVAKARPKKRRLSAAGRRAIIEATKRPWAAFRKARAK